MRNTVSPAIEFDTLEPRDNWFQSWFPFLRWIPTSPVKLKHAEEKFIDFIKVPSEGFYVNIGKITGGDDCKIWTRKFQKPGVKEDDTIPLVMIHGMGAGLAMFALNIDTLAQDRVVYAIDLPGFGRSSRPVFSSDPEEVERQYVSSIEEWRKQVGLEKINILGHSFGGFLSALYTMEYQDRIHRTILADPWGMVDRPEDIVERMNLSLGFRTIFSIVKNFNPLWGMRASGPAGPRLMRRMRPDLMRKFEDLVGEENLQIVGDYLFHCNGQNPAGETAFSRVMNDFFWAKTPALPRLEQANIKVPITFLYGSDSWIARMKPEDDDQPGSSISHSSVLYIEHAGHHVYADRPELFNKTVRQALDT